MNLDLSSITAFALEGSGAAAAAMDEARTLTLPALSRAQRLDQGPVSTAKLGPARDAKAWPFRISVAGAAPQGLTVTF